MDAATQSRIFDPFFSTKFTGRGLGLAAVGGVVRSQKGAIKLTTAPGAGSCFTVLFPLPEVAPPEPAPPLNSLPAHAPAPRPTATVLLVDDEKMVVKMTKKALERLGFKVLTAAGGPAAIDLFQRHSGECSVVILDVSMPGMNGSDVLPQLRKIRPDVPVIVSSGYGEAEIMPLFLQQRVAGFLQKPYTPKKLAELVTSALDQVSRQSDSASKPVDFTAIAFRWLALPQRFEMRHRFALFRQLEPQLPARVGLAVERLRNRRRAAHLAENQDFHLKIAAIVLHLQQVADADLARRFGCLSVGFNPAELTCPGSKRARLEESGRPQPLVYSHAGHDSILVYRSSPRHPMASTARLPACPINLDRLSKLVPLSNSVFQFVGVRCLGASRRGTLARPALSRVILQLLNASAMPSMWSRTSVKFHCLAEL